MHVVIYTTGIRGTTNLFTKTSPVSNKGIGHKGGSPQVRSWVRKAQPWVANCLECALASSREIYISAGFPRIRRE